MIAFVQGMLVSASTRESQQWVVVDVQGVGYQVWTHSRALDQLPNLGSLLKMHTVLVPREDSMTLYGFLEEQERELFTLLTSVSGVGPRLALALLDTLGAMELVQAVVRENFRALALTPGVGSKTAQRITLELKSKMEKFRQEAGLGVSSGVSVQPQVYEEAQMALLALGFSPKEVAQALQQVSGQNPGSAAEEWIRSSIAWLSSR
ncbi:MAG: Holliday junction branch migration protein RuvA [Gloeobacterales cyanobacterium]